MKKIYITSVILSAVLFAAAIAGGLGAYPVASVNGKWITARKYSKLLRAGSAFSFTLSEASAKVSSTTSKIAPDEIQAALLDQAISDEIIGTAAREKFGADLANLQRSKLKKFENNDRLRQAAVQVFQLTHRDFDEIIILPQINRELLSARLYIDGAKFDDWLLAAKKDAEVRIYSSKFAWNGEKVIIR